MEQAIAGVLQTEICWELEVFDPWVGMRNISSCAPRPQPES